MQERTKIVIMVESWAKINYIFKISVISEDRGILMYPHIRFPENKITYVLFLHEVLKSKINFNITQESSQSPK
jgi:hypothetical protein